MIKGIDLYTKIILTVIAVCLTCIVAKDINIIPEASAQRTNSPVQRAEAEKQHAIDVNIVSVAGRQLTPDPFVLRPYGQTQPSLPVRIIEDSRMGK